MILRGTFPSVAAVTVIDANVIRGLRVDGSPPCADGLRQALSWIGDRTLPIGEALAQAKESLYCDYYDWACRALGLTGDGYGDGSGYGSGDGSGDGYGYGYGSGSGGED